jgi:hypothetical protein
MFPLRAFPAFVLSIYEYFADSRIYNGLHIVQPFLILFLKCVPTFLVSNKFLLILFQEFTAL